LLSVTNASGGDGSDIGAYEFISVPQLNIQRGANNNVVLFWATNGGTAHLEYVTNLPVVTNWSMVTNTPVYIGNQAYVTNLTTGARKFYRLSLP
jgi:hypothetical protein